MFANVVEPLTLFVRSHRESDAIYIYIHIHIETDKTKLQATQVFSKQNAKRGETQCFVLKTCFAQNEAKTKNTVLVEPWLSVFQCLVRLEYIGIA